MTSWRLCLPSSLLLAAALAAEDGASGPRAWEGCYREGLRLKASGDLEAARRSLGKATALDPRHEGTRRALEEAEAALRERLLGEGKASIERGDLRAGLERLRRAAVLGRGSDREEVQLLAKHSYREHRGEWLHRDEVVAREKAEERQASARRAALALGERFRLDRREDARIFTDHDDGEVLPFTERLHRLIASLRREHARLFAYLEPGPATAERGAGIDVVVFRRREDYFEAAASTDTLGMFLPRRGASFFYLGDRAPADLSPVLVHEVVHQLDFKVLGLRYPPPWLEEGLAVCFEGAGVGPDGRIAGEPALPADQATRLRTACPPGSPRWWGMGRLAGLVDLRPLQGTEAVHDFHAQAALVVHHLLESGPAARELFFALVERARRPEARPEHGLRDLEAALRERGTAVEELDRALVQAAERLAPAEEAGSGAPAR
ncbi:MAG: hypothetical protein HY721_29540 [Planctomycetes bacterium]|nr:hypothetical protein [Planctomycetota bacterium]